MNEFCNTIKSTIEGVAEEKNRILDTYIDDLKKVTLTIAEKVIQTSLKSSGRDHKENDCCCGRKTEKDAVGEDLCISKGCRNDGTGRCGTVK